MKRTLRLLRSSTLETRRVQNAFSVEISAGKPRGRPRKVVAAENTIECAGSASCTRRKSSDDSRSLESSAVQETKSRDQKLPDHRSILSRELVKEEKFEEDIQARQLSKRATPRVHLIEATSKHHDLESFLDYASRVALSPATSVYKGTHYEYTVAQALQVYDFDLSRTGRSNDLGIDLIGQWVLPGSSGHLRVLVQCKALQSTPSMVRELEGALAGAPAGWNDRSTMALLATAKPITAGVRASLQRTQLAMGVLHITTDGILRQFVWNQAAHEACLSGLSVANTYSIAKETIETAAGLKTGAVEKSIALCWLGHDWAKAREKPNTSSIYKSAAFVQ